LDRIAFASSIFFVYYAASVLTNKAVGIFIMLTLGYVTNWQHNASEIFCRIARLSFKFISIALNALL